MGYAWTKVMVPLTGLITIEAAHVHHHRPEHFTLIKVHHVLGDIAHVRR